MSNRFLNSLAFLALAAQTQAAICQDTKPPVITGGTIHAKGISGYEDKKDRNPEVTVQPVTETDATTKETKVKLLIDAKELNSDYQQMPMRFSVYINREFYHSQIRAAEFPEKAIGIQIPASTATIPFNYSVIVELLHPNRTFTTVAHGAVYASDLTATFDCTVTIKKEKETDQTFTAKNVATTQSSNSGFYLAFEAENEAKNETVNISGLVDVEGETAQSNLSVKESSTNTTTIKETSGSIVKDAGKMISLELNAVDQSLVVSCE